MFAPVFAQSNHTLEWGADVDERFIYALQREYYSDLTSQTFMENQGGLPYLAEIEAGEKFILEIYDLETIEAQINESSQIPLSYCNLRKESDDSIFSENLTGYVLPIGDWDFLEDLESATGLSFVETEDEWGTIGTTVIPSGGGNDITVYVETRYEKENGTLRYLRHRYTALGTDLIDIVLVHWYPGMPTIIGGEIQLATILIIVMSGFTGVIVAFLVYKFIKGKKSIVQRLGE
jgi:hypothetical protein